MSSLSKKGLKLKNPLRTPSHPDPCIPKSFKEKNTRISYWSRGGGQGGGVLEQITPESL